MKTFAEVMNGRVNLVRTCEDEHVLECAPPLQFIVITDETGPALPGHSWDGKTFQPPPEPTEEERQNTKREAAKEKIRILEMNQARSLREAVLFGDKVRLLAIDDSISELRKEL